MWRKIRLVEVLEESDEVCHIHVLDEEKGLGCFLFTEDNKYLQIQFLRACHANPQPDVEYHYRDYVGISVMALFRDEAITDFKSLPIN